MAATELIKRIRTVATSEGLEKLVADLRAGASANTQFSESGNVVSITTARLSREQLSAANAFEATRKRVDEAYRNFVRYRTEVANVARAVEQGKASQEEANRTLELAAIKYKQVAAEQDNFVRVQDAYIARARAYREALDPAFAAQNRFNDALREAEDLYTAGAISADVYAAGVERATRQLREAEVAIVQTAKAQAEQANARFASSIGVRDDFDTAKRAADIAAYGDALDATRAKYDDIFAAQLAYKRGLKEVKEALDVGAISEEVYKRRLDEKKAAFVEVMREMGRVSAPERAFNQAFDEATAQNAAFNSQEDANSREIARAHELALAMDRQRDAQIRIAEAAKRNREEFFPLERAASAYQARLEKLQQLKPQLDADAYADALRREEAAYRDTVRAIEEASEAGRKRSAVQSENARLTAEAESLRRRNDPDYEAQAKYNDALERANVLLEKEKIDLKTYRLEVERATKELAAFWDRAEEAARARASGRDSDLNQRAVALTERNDPFAGPGRKLNDAISNASELYREGKISLDLYNAELERAGEEMADVYRRLGLLTQAEREYAAARDAAYAENAARDSAAKGYADAAESVKRQRAELIPLVKAQQEYKEKLNQIGVAAKEGAITEKERAEAVQRTKNAFAEQVKYLQGAGLAAGAASKNFRLTNYEVTNLTYQLNDMATMLAAGSSPFQVIATQGGQVYQILAGSRGGLKEGIKSLTEQVKGFITPARAAAGVLAAIGVAAAVSYSSWLADQKKLENALNGLGRNLGTTAGELDRVSVAGAAAAGVSVSSARDMSVAFASTGKIGTELYESLIVSSRNYARVMGKEPLEAAEKLAEAFADPAAGAAELDKQLNFLDQSTLDLIRSLSNAGRRLEAQQLLSRKLNETLPDAAKNLSALERAWNAVANAVSRASNAVGAGISQVVDGKTEDQLYKEAQDRLARARGAQSGPYAGKFGINNTAQMKADEETIRQIEERRRQREAEGERLRAQQQEKDAIAAARARDPRYAELEGLTKQITATEGVIARLRAASATSFDEMWSGTDRQKELEDSLTGLKNRYNEIADSQGMLKPITESMRKEMDLQLAVVNSTTQAERNRAQAALDEYRARAAGSNDAVVAATKENSLLQSNAELNAQLAQAQRDRVRSAEEAVTAQQLEVALIGKTAGEAAVLRANYQALVDLQREAAQSGTGFDQAKYEAIKKQNEALREQIELVSRASLREQVGFDIDQLGRSKIDQTIASTQRSMGLAVDFTSYDANLIRTREYLSEIKDASSEAFTGFVSDLRQGVSAGEAFNSILDRMLDRLFNLASDQAISDLFKAGTSGGNGGIFGSIASAVTSMFGGSSVGTVGSTTGAIMTKAEGGPISGPGTGTSDSIPAWLSNGEYVTRASAAAHPQNRKILDFMNAGGIFSMPRFANGGAVGSATSAAMSERAAGYAAGSYPAVAQAVAAPANLNMQVNVQTLPGTTADVEPRQNADGSVSMDVVMRRVKQEIAADLESGGPLARKYQDAFNLKRALR